MARRAKSASAVVDPRTKAIVRAHLDIHQLAGIAGEIVNSWRLWRARPRPDAVGILIDALIKFDGVVNSNSLTPDEWRRGGSVDYRGSRVVGVALCGLVEVYFEIVEQLGLTAIVGGDSIIEGTLDANQLAEVESLVDSLARLAEILRSQPTGSDVSPVEMQAVEPVGRLDPYTSLKKFSDSLRGKEQKFLQMAIRSMEMEPTIGLRFASLSEFFDDPDFDAEKFGKNKIAILNEKLKRHRMNYRLTQKASAAILREIPAKA